MNMNNIKTVMLMVLMAVIMMLIGGLVGGRTGLTVMLFFSIAMNIYSYWCSDSLVLRWSGAQEVTREQAPQLYDLVEKLASRAGLPMPRVCIIDADEPNAFATGRNPEHAAVAVVRIKAENGDARSRHAEVAAQRLVEQAGFVLDGFLRDLL